MFTDLVNKVRAYLPAGDFALLERAGTFAADAHAGQHRASGEAFVTHGIAVAEILTELRLDMPTIAAALLHDCLEDTPVTADDIRRQFGQEILGMVEGVTKISSYSFADPEVAQAENWRKMLLAVTRDIRVILIKLADRLHNLRTIAFLSPERQHNIAVETLNLYAPFAQRLGIYRWKSELEDLSFAVVDPAAFATVRDACEQRTAGTAQAVAFWQRALEEQVRSSGIPFRCSARPKSLYGIFKKMQRQQKEFSAIHDIIGLRLITDSVANCYALFDLVSRSFSVVEGTFTDYITSPKINHYQSLHITLTAPNGFIAELQIRTEDMHRLAEFGIAAHWRYKENAPPRAAAGSSKDIDQKLDWLKQVLEWQRELPDVREFLDAFRVECRFEQIFVFTPKGKVVPLPQGATPVDFAYAVHSEIGAHCYGAKVGDKMVPLYHRLETGNVCEIITRKQAHPNNHWLEFVITARARAKIRHWMRENEPKKPL